MSLQVLFGVGLVVLQLHGLKALASEQGPKTNGRGLPNRAVACGFHTTELMTRLSGLPPAVTTDSNSVRLFFGSFQFLGPWEGLGIRRSPEYLAAVIGMTFTLNRDLNRF
ncbi:MAG TPA: hypothetical protein VGM09_13045 [Bradyrhizobium sp.]